MNFSLSVKRESVESALVVIATRQEYMYEFEGHTLVIQEGNFLFHSSGRKCGNLVAIFVEGSGVRNNCDSLDDLSSWRCTFNVQWNCARKRSRVCWTG